MTSLPINKILQGNTLDVLKDFPDESIDCCVTSPPYYGLRCYGTEPLVWNAKEGCEHEWIDFIRKGTSGGINSEKVQIKGQDNFQIVDDSQQNYCSKCGAWIGSLGLEPHPQMYVDHLVQIFGEVKRVLKSTGSFYLNLGDTYFGGNLCVGQPEGWQSLSTNNKKEKYDTDKMNDFIKQRNKLRSNWLQPKQLLLIPSRVAIAMQEDGWLLRNDILWKKLNPMPSSAEDRRTNSYEHVFFFVKSRKYYFDMDSIREPYKESSKKRIEYPVGHIRSNAMGLKESTGYHCDKELGLNPLGKAPEDVMEFDYKESKFSSKEEESTHRQGFSKERNEIEYHPLGKHPRDIIELPTESFEEAHFATFGQSLITPLIKSSSPEFICKKCGKAREKIWERTGFPDPDDNQDDQGRMKSSGEIATDTGRRKILSGEKHAQFKTENPDKFLGYTDCNCHVGFDKGIVLDPFMGSGTTALVAKQLGRNYIGIELNPSYIEMANNRVNKVNVVYNYIDSGENQKNLFIDEVWRIV